ncbi:MAG: hypothetical protein ABW094_02695 [Candidatus Thiodiazotropha sp.]
MGVNKESLSILISKLESFCKNQKIQFPEEIENLKKLHASKGLLISGATIKASCRILEENLEKRKEFFLCTLEELPFEYQKDLAVELNKLFEKYVPIDFSDFRPVYLDVLHMAAKDNMAANSKGLEIAEAGNGRVREQLLLEIRQYIHTLQNNAKLGRESKIYIYTELVVLVTTAFLAGMWASDSSGNYEPWIVILGLCLAVLDILRRYRAKNA